MSITRKARNNPAPIKKKNDSLLIKVIKQVDEIYIVFLLVMFEF